MKIDDLKFAISGGIIIALSFALTIFGAIVSIPGFLPFAKLLEQGYGFYGVSVSPVGLIIAAFWGFIEGFVWFGLFGLIYNFLIKK